MTTRLEGQTSERSIRNRSRYWWEADRSFCITEGSGVTRAQLLAAEEDRQAELARGDGKWWLKMTRSRRMGGEEQLYNDWRGVTLAQREETARARSLVGLAVSEERAPEPHKALGD